MSNKAPSYVKLKQSVESTTQTTTTQTSVGSRKRHHRTNSNSPRNSRSLRSSSSRTSIVVDAETQTDSMDMSDPDLSPTTTSPPSCPKLGRGVPAASTSSVYPQRVILQEFRNGIEEECANGNCIQLHYMEPHPEQGKLNEVLTFVFVSLLTQYSIEQKLKLTSTL